MTQVGTTYSENIFIKNLHLIILMLIALLAFFLRYPAIARDSLWLDEAWRLQIFTVPLDFSDLKILISQVLGFDGLMRFIVYLFGANEWSLRAVSFYSGVLAVPFLYLLGYKITKKILPPLIAAFLLAINPWHIAYSSEMAPYALGSLFFVLFLISLNRFHEKNDYSSLVVSILIGTFLSVMHLYFFVLTLICSILLFIVDRNRSSIKNKIILLFLFIFLLNIFQIMPYFAWVETDQVSMRYNINWTVGFPLKVLNAISSGPIPNRFVSTVSHMPFWYVLFFYTLTALTSLLFIRSFVYSIKLHKKFEVVMISSTFLYVLFIYLQGHLANSAFVRYLIPVVPLLFLIVVQSIMTFIGGNPKSYKYAIFIFCFFTLNYSLALYQEKPGEKYKPKYRDFFVSFADECTKSKVYFLNPNFTELPIFNYYLKDTDCNIIVQQSFKDFFEVGNISLINNNELAHNKQDKWMAKEIVKLIDEKAIVYVVSLRNQIRTYNMVKSTDLLFDKIIDKQIPDLLILKLK
jgi:hypothetical protein